jgi:glycosyltransferase involved in cell wall biosynthesis
LKILYIATSFPEPEKGATIYTDLAEALHEAGHEIIVAVSEQPKNKKNTDMKRERGINVLRIVTGNYYDVGLFEKGLTTLKIPFLMKRGISKYLGYQSFDLILFEAPPVTNAALVAWAKKRFNSKAYLMLKDIFPQNAVDIEVIKGNGILYNYFKSKEKRLYNTADFIGCMSNSNRSYIINHSPWLDPNKLEIFPNTKKVTDEIQTEVFPLRNRYGIPSDACVFLFGGNMGRPQYIDLLCNAVCHFKDNQSVFFLFVGRGTDRYKLEETIKNINIKNALLIENLPRHEYEQITKECNVGLIVLDPRFTIPNYPSRILSYMEYAKPVLAVTDKATDIKELIEESQCGEWVWSGDSNSFIMKINEMAKSSELLIKGENGRKYLLEHFTVEHSVGILEKHFQ